MMKQILSRLALVVLVPVLLFPIVLVRAQNFNIPQNEAKGILDNFALANDDVNAHALGLPTSSQLRNAKIVNPRKVYILEIDTLKKLHKINATIWSSLRRTNNIVYEVRDVNGEILALLETEDMPGRPRRILSLGNRAAALAITADTAMRRRSEVIIRVPALYMEFVSFQSDGAQPKRLYVPLARYPDAGLFKGAVYNEVNLRNNIKPVADAYQGWPE